MLQRVKIFYFKQRLYAAENGIFYRFKLLRIKRFIKNIASRLWNNRVIGVLAAGVLSGLVAYWLVGQQIVYVYSHLDDKTIRDDILKNAGIWNFITVIVAIPTAFLVWLYRDQNNRHAIENARKDVNLKDFQRLSELAAGLHLVEDKVTTEKEDGKTTIKIESSKIPDGDNSTISRREGSVSLQIAAVYQIKAFLDGEYGEYFQRPAFQLLMSIWRTKMLPYVEALNTTDALDDGQIKNILGNMQAAASIPLTIAIQDLLRADNGHAFRQQKYDLHSVVLAGMGLSSIDFGHFNLVGSQFQGVTFLRINFVKSILVDANFSCAHMLSVNLASTNIIDVNFSNARLSNVDFCEAYFLNANFAKTNFLESNLSHAKFYESNLSHAHFFKVDFSEAYFYRSDLSSARFSSAYKLHNARFVDCKADDVQVFETYDGKYVDRNATLEFRNKLKEAGLVLPDEMYDIGNIPITIDSWL